MSGLMVSLRHKENDVDLKSEALGLSSWYWANSLSGPQLSSQRMNVWPSEPSPGLCSCDRNLFASRAGEELFQEGRKAGSSVLRLRLLRTT